MNPTLAVFLCYAIVVGGVIAYVVGQWRQSAALRDRLSASQDGGARGDQPNAG